MAGATAVAEATVPAINNSPIEGEAAATSGTPQSMAHLHQHSADRSQPVLTLACDGVLTGPVCGHQLRRLHGPFSGVMHLRSPGSAHVRLSPPVT